MKTWKNIAELADRDHLKKLIDEEGNSRRIADKLGCSQESVKNALRHHGLRGSCFVISAEMRKRLKL